VLVFALVIIFGLGALAAAGVGIGGMFHVRALHSLSQMHSTVMTIIGGGVGISCVVIGSIGLIKSGVCREAKMQDNERGTLPTNTSKAQEIQQQPEKEPDTAEEKREPSEQKATEQSVIKFNMQASGYSGAQPLIARLAFDNLANIFQYLTLKELAIAFRVCKYWYHVGVSDHVWKKFFETLFCQINPQLNTQYKLEYTKKLFEKPKEFLLEGCEAKVHAIICDSNANAIITYSEEQCSIWSPVTSKCLKKFPDNTWLVDNKIAVEEQVLARIQDSKVFLSNIHDSQETFQYEHQTNNYDPHAITIGKDIVATIAGRNIKVWSYKNSQLLWEFNVNFFAPTLIIHNDYLVCFDKKTVEVFSLQTGKKLHTISAKRVEAYKNWIICRDNNTFSIYSLETGQCLRNFPQKIPKFTKIIIHNDVLICLSIERIREQNSILSTGYFSTITTYSVVNGALLQQFIVDGLATMMMMSGDDLLVCCKSQEIVKAWKLSQKK